jgi:hypothetical protein
MPQDAFRSAAFLFLLFSSSVSAGPSEILKEYASLKQDLGLVDGFVAAFQGVNFYDPSEFPALKEQASGTRDWVSIHAYYERFHVVKGLLVAIKASFNSFHNPEAKAQMGSLVASFNIGLESVAGGAHGGEYWDSHRKGVMDKLGGIKTQLLEIQKSLRQKLDSRTTEIGNFLEAARLKDPDYFSHAQQDDLKRLEHALEETRQKQAVQKEQLLALELQLASERQQLERCKSAQAALSEECRLLRADSEKLRRELSTTYSDVLDSSIREFHERQKAQQPKGNEKVFQGLQHLGGLQYAFQNSINRLLDEKIKALYPGQGSEVSFVKLVVQVNEYSALTRNTKIAVSLSVRGMDCPVVQYLVQRLDKTGEIQVGSSVVSDFLTMNLPKIFQVAEKYAADERRGLLEAEDRARRRCEELRAPLYGSAPAYTVPSIIQSVVQKVEYPGL